jgi:hypothetical protein
MQQPGTYMKKNTSKRKPQGKAASHAYALLAKAESAEKILEAARTQWRLLKVEHKQARKAFKQAKKAAKLARREARAAAKTLKRKGIKLLKASKPAVGGKRPTVSLHKPGKSAVAKRNGGASHLTSIQASNVPQPAAVELQA